MGRVETDAEYFKRVLREASDFIKEPEEVQPSGLHAKWKERCDHAEHLGVALTRLKMSFNVMKNERDDWRNKYTEAATKLHAAYGDVEEACVALDEEHKEKTGLEKRLEDLEARIDQLESHE